jgi:hypothetical protein
MSAIPPLTGMADIRALWSLSIRVLSGRSTHALLFVRSPFNEGLDFASTELFAALFNALRRLVAVLSDLSVCSCVLKVLFSTRSRDP